MKVKLTRSIEAGGHREWTLDIERAPDPDCVEAAEKFELALRAIEAAPAAAEEIAAAALGDED